MLGEQDFNEQLDIKAIMAEYEEMMADGEEAPDNKPQLPPKKQPTTSEAGDRKLIQEMITTMRELTDEVKQLREQIDKKPNDVSDYPSERTPRLATASEDGSAPETKSEAQSEQEKPEVQSEQEKPAKKNKALSIISSVLFYVVIVAMVLGAFLMRSTSKGEPFMIAGFSAANVLTSSMEDVYPRGSLIITKHMDAKELQIGDDITFMVSEDSSITHRIIGITENYQGTGARAFQTQGTKNPNPDKEMVAAANVVGKVIFHSKILGDFANFVKENWPILIFILIVIIGLITFLKWNAKQSDGDDEEPKDKPKEKKRNKHSERRSESNGDE